MKTNYLLNFLLLCIICLFYINQSEAQCHFDDWTALKALYENAGGDGWTNKGSWTWMIKNPNSPPATCDLQLLQGVELENGRVFRITLSENSLTGIIPPEIGDITYLKFLYLGNNSQDGSNKLTGNLPDQIGNLTNLEILNLSYNNLSGSIPVSIGNLTNLIKLRLQRNQLTGDLPSQIGNLTNLTHLYLYRNNLTGELPAGICNFNNLIELILGNNRLEGSIPSCIGNIGNSLQILNLGSNNLSGTIPNSIGDLSNLKDLYLGPNNFTGNIPTQIGNLSNLENLGIGSTFVEGNIPTSFGNLSTLKKLWLSHNYLTGSIPTQLTNLPQLEKLDLRLNQFTGTVPTFSNTSLKLHVQQNYFTCNQIQANLNQNQQLALYEYEPQYKTPSNYNTIQSYVIKEADIAQVSLTLSPNFSGGVNGISYQWKRNNKIINGANNATLTLQNIQGSNAGKYTLHFQDQNCPLGIDFVSDPIYIIAEGYDIYGYNANTKQVMVEFDNSQRTMFFENSVLLPNGGIVKKVCNCNRELYLWEFSTTEDAVDAIVAINAKHQSIKPKPKVDGSFNNNIEIGTTGSNGTAYDVLTNTSNNYLYNVTIFLLDSGLDDTDINNTPYLMSNAPVDNCYNVNTSSGYNYTTTANTLNNNYVDELWHGTFGFRAIIDELTQPNNIDVVPLKIFDKNGQGSLFDLACAIYHAVDHNADIINISAGVKGNSSKILENAINKAREKGIFICTAAGNDGLSIDIEPQYPAYFASQYHYNYDESGLYKIDSARYDNVISIAAINAQNGWSNFSNYGLQSVTMSAYGENIHGYGLSGNDVVASGTSMATYFVTRELALEIAHNKNRSYQQIWTAFESNRLVFNASTAAITRTGKHLNVPIVTANVDAYDCVQFIDLQQTVNSGTYSAIQILQCNSSISPNGTIEFNAGERIRLNNGFSTNQSQNFKAQIDDCTN